MKKCRHDNTTSQFLEGRLALSSYRWTYCDDCKQFLSLGPSNDDSPAVQVEMRAAALIAVGAYIDESNVWADEERGTIIITSNDSAFEQHNASLWAWDPSRPIADQLAETAADGAAADESDEYADGVA